jgi:tetratricopeptide (TPR) repeat protein
MTKRLSTTCSVEPEIAARGNGVFVSFLLACATLFAPYSFGEPRTPANDNVVIERLPATSVMRTLAPLRRAVRTSPDDLSSALQLARSYIELGRDSSDPRFISYAQATLAPWMRHSQPPVAVMVLQATALQNLHQFDAALVLLDRALALDPDNSQAWLTRATLQQVQGEYRAARNSCRQLLRSTDQIIALTCLFTTDSLSGSLASSYNALQRLATSSQAMRDPSLNAWIVGQLGDMALRLGHLSAAEQHYSAARQFDPEDVYLRAAHADLLLALKRNAEVIQLLKASVAHDVLLLRLAIAGKRAGDPDAQRWIALFDARRRATRPHDNPHAREHARFLLDVLNQPSAALVLARENWAHQREPQDVDIYARAAAAARSDADQRKLNEWLTETRFEHQTLATLRAAP